MAVPKKKQSRSRRDSRRATYSLDSAAFVVCPNCNGPKRSHRVCGECGWYKDRYVIPVVEVEV